MNRQFLIAGSVFAGTAVVLGAFGAHGLQPVLSEQNLHIFRTAVEYQFYHSFALILTGIIALHAYPKYLRLAGNLFIAGIFLFCGSLYCLSLMSDLTWLGIITPFGGLSFIAGWLTLIFSLMKKNSAHI